MEMVGSSRGLQSTQVRTDQRCCMAGISQRCAANAERFLDHVML
jgi:hypothetical protein